MTGSRHVNDARVIARLRTSTRTWAVVGLSHNQERAAYRVARVLRAHGKRVIPLHPAAPVVEGEQGYAALADLPDGEQVDVVDCFVRSQLVGAVVDEAIAQRDRLGIRAVWMQLGVVDEAAAARARTAGLEVVMDTCPKLEWPPAVS